MKSFTTLFVSTLALLPYVCAHGFVSKVMIDGKAYNGNTPNGDEDPSPIRLINDISPVKGAFNPAMNCGPNARKAQIVAPAKPGSKMSFFWASGQPSEPWPHNIGPMITYMAECTGTTCDKFDAAQAKWFKIDEVGRKADNKNEWVQKDLQQKGGSYSLMLPKTLKAGDYLVRHEIIALHLAQSQGGAEFYPSCTQIRLEGSGSDVIQDTVSLPGAYKDTDPGILYDAFNPAHLEYTFPGPPIAKLISTSGALSNDNGSDNSTTPSSSSSAPAASASATKKTCYMMRDENGIKRRYSRVMRAILPPPYFNH